MSGKDEKGLSFLSIVVVILVLIGGYFVLFSPKEEKTEESAPVKKESEIEKQPEAVKDTGRFLPNESPVGSWTTVDFVNNIEDFEPGKKSWGGNFSMQNLVFYHNGQTSRSLFRWSKGVVLFTRFSNRKGIYHIKEIGAAKYLFMEWISADVVDRGMKPSYYVFKKESGAYQPPKVIARLLPNESPHGSWTTVDFVENIEDFDPYRRQHQGRFAFTYLSFYRRGRTSSFLYRWGDGQIFYVKNKMKGKYCIKQIGSRKYLFMEWISGDVTIRGQKPWYYVLMK